MRDLLISDFRDLKTSVFTDLLRLEVSYIPGILSARFSDIFLLQVPRITELFCSLS